VSTRARRDYYEVLGIPRDADRETIRRAFRTLAAEVHPDVSDDPAALDRFREIAEAYEVLSRRDSRDRYDRFGFEPRGVGTFEPHATARARPSARLFDDLIASAVRDAARGDDVVVELELTAEDAARGSSRGVRFRTSERCETCRGLGAAPGTARVRCPECAGRGRVREEAAAGGFHLRSCGRCGGTGFQILTPCEACAGTGRTARERSLLVELPPGVQAGDEIRVAGKGHAGEEGGEPGDVVVRVVILPAPDSPAARRVALAGLVLAVGLILVLLLR
jgi:molecular chaperone DnaJ